MDQQISEKKINGIQTTHLNTRTNETSIRSSKAIIQSKQQMGGSIQHNSNKGALVTSGSSKHGQRSGVILNGANKQAADHQRQPMGSRQSQTGGAGGSQHNSYNNQQSSILMNSGGLAMQNLTGGISNSDSKKLNQMASQKHSVSGVIDRQNLNSQNTYTQGRYQTSQTNNQSMLQNNEQEMNQLISGGQSNVLGSPHQNDKWNNNQNGGQNQINMSPGVKRPQAAETGNYGQSLGSNPQQIPQKQRGQKQMIKMSANDSKNQHGGHFPIQGGMQYQQTLNNQDQNSMNMSDGRKIMRQQPGGMPQQNSLWQQQQQQQQQQMTPTPNYMQQQRTPINQPKGNNLSGMRQQNTNGPQQRSMYVQQRQLSGATNGVGPIQGQTQGTPSQQNQSNGGPSQSRRVEVYNQVSSNGIQRKKVENLPRTGIEYPMMRDLGHGPFISPTKEFEPLQERKISETLLDEYIQNDQNRCANAPSSLTFPVVYDYIEQSPYYDGENAKHGPYIDEKDLIELPNPSDQSNGSINEPYQKRYYFNPTNLPYSLEQSHQYGQVSESRGTSIASKQRGGHHGGPRLNRYYEKLKPYYRIDYTKVEEPPQGSNTDNPVQGLPIDQTLLFESRFESGNLRKTMKVGPHEYECYLKNDYGTQSFCQWYFFRIQNTRKDQTYRFHLVNFMKPDSTYQKGMRPLVYSMIDAEATKIGWQRDCQNIAYYQTGRVKKAYKNQNSSQFRSRESFSPYQIANANSNTQQPANDGYGSMYYCLTFEWTAKYDNDTIYFAHCYPYTYTDLLKFEGQTCTFDNKDKVRKTVLCKSLAGNDVDMLIVTNFASQPEEIAVRKAIILTARVHPGESNASWMMHGIIEFLVSDDEKAQYLRDQFVFKIIPMLNPDGVIVGNYRCSLVGQDLNRQWIGSSAKLYPINYHTKLMMKKTQESREILFFCDFHGHSTGRNVFMYGNSQTKPSDRLKEKIFPMMFSENCENFSFDDCSFMVHKSKESCGRIVMWREFNLVNSYTCEASFCGPTRGIHNQCHFNIELFQNVGKVFCKTMVDMSQDKDRVKKTMSDLQLRFPINAPPRKGYNMDDDEENE